MMPQLDHPIQDEQGVGSDHTNLPGLCGPVEGPAGLVGSLPGLTVHLTDIVGAVPN